MDENDVESAPNVVPDASSDPSLRDILHRGAGAFSRGDLDAYLAVMAPEVELSLELDQAGRPIFPGLQPLYQGHEGIRQFWDDWHSGFERGVPLEVIGVVYGTGCYAALARYRAVGRDGVTAEREITSAVEVRDGLIWRFRDFAHWEDALEALGMPTDLTPGPP